MNAGWEASVLAAFRLRIGGDPKYVLLSLPPDCERLEPALVKGRQSPVGAHRMGEDT